ncbi:FAD-dependent oxidoreductase [Oxyplasma meridianum]|uniref:FAD-dependent oxidoreductase n=1 Tax=Oxyplasma meridianum TaxID=3073602 RepID=A0AAX4NGZ1_9ARCH
MATKYDVIIIGGASAGLSAALYTSRQNLRTLVITKDIGGQALLTDSIQNYPGFGNIGGFELLTKFQEQTMMYGTEFLYDEVQSVSKSEEGFRVKSYSQENTAEVLILAFGKTPRDLGVSGENELRGKGVSYCAVCDGPLFKSKKVAVVGNGDNAIEAASYLSSLVSNLYIIQSTEKTRGDEETLNSLKNMKNVEFRNGSKVDRILGENSVTGLELQTKEGKNNLEIDAVFIEMGYIAKTELVKDLVELNKIGEVVVNKFCETTQEGIFACGDVTDTPYKQVVISAGQGAIAALSAYNYIQRKKGRPTSKTDWKTVPIQKEEKSDFKLSRN